jgi:V-type H+-transporting ATPase subunit C
MATYWLVALPVQDTADRTWATLQARTTYDADLASNFRFPLPADLRVGTLDALMGLSDDLARVNAAVEGVVNRVRRQLFDLAMAAPAPAAGAGRPGSAAADTGSGTEGPHRSSDPAAATVDGLPPSSYLERWAWDESKYPPRRPLGETVAAITEAIAKLEDDLKLRLGEHGTARAAVAAIARKATGSLAVRDLAPHLASLPPGALVDTENLVTLAAVVPRGSAREWLASYETLTDWVVPRSASLACEDPDYALYTVTLFRRVGDAFKAAARGLGVQVRDIESATAGGDAAGGGGPSTADHAAALRADLEAKRASLAAWCGAAYGEAFAAWAHVCAVRLFVESVLRYGLPPNLLPVLVRPRPKAGPRLRKVLAGLFGGGAPAKYCAAGEDGGGGGGEAGGEFHPYVSFTLAVDG